MFEKILKALDDFESGMADGSLRKRSEVIKLLTEIANQSIVLTNNKQRLPTGSKSLLLRISKLANDLMNGVREDSLAEGSKSTFTVLREMSRDRVGPLHTALERISSGEGLSQGQKAQVAEHEADTDKSQEIAALIDGYDFGGALVDRQKLSEEEAKEYLMQFLSGMTVSELRSIDTDAFNNLELSEIVTAVRDSNGELRYTASGKPVVNQNAAGIRALRKSLVVEHDDDLFALTQSYGKLQHRLPKSLKGMPFSAVRYPVIPLFKDINASRDPGKLRGAGFKVTPVGDHFIVLEQQFLLVIDPVKIGADELFRNITVDGKHLRSVNKSKSRTAGAKLNEKLKDVMDSINARSEVKYAIASNTAVRNPNNGKLALVWIIPEHSRKSLENALHTTQVDWDIPRYTASAQEEAQAAKPVKK